MMIKLLGLAGLACLSSFTFGQGLIYMPDSTNNRMVAFNPFDGSVVNSNLFGLAGGTPIHAMQVGNEVWVSEQTGDRVSRWSVTGASLGAVTGQMDNIRGMGLINGTVYVTNAGTGNSAPGAALRMFTTSGTSLGHFTTPNAPGPFGILEYQGAMLVSSSSANDDIHKYSLTGTSLGTFYNGARSFFEQMDYAADGNILAAVFSSNVVVKLNASTGAEISSFAATGARGVFQLGNGNILWTNGSGAHVFNTATGGSSQIYTGGGRYLDLVVVPEPATMLVFLGGLAVLRRRSRAAQ
ncbi:MAG: PEP-CTERM sorting domain-containing protein [Armatimonadetes bacterium]|nr:PEP-CTERM sorting domain-containing protein [Armatimonadota bacterium]